MPVFNKVEGELSKVRGFCPACAFSAMREIRIHRVLQGYSLPCVVSCWLIDYKASI